MTGKALRCRGVYFVAIVALVVAQASAVFAASKYKVLYTFTDGVDGGELRGSLVFDHAGNLYGTALSGGAYGVGTVFQVAPKRDGRWTETVLYSFKNDGNDGNTPMAGLVFDKTGNLYGTTSGGGSDASGTVFQLSPNGNGTWTEQILHSFDGTDGMLPYTGALIFDKQGNSYGTTPYGGDYNTGIAFQLTKNGNGTWSANVMHSFGSGLDGKTPIATLMVDRMGSLYGTTLFGGAHGSGTSGGTVFQLTANGSGWDESVLHSFRTNGVDGRVPYAGLIFDKGGNLYGTASEGGAYNDGTVFKLTPDGKGGWTERVLHAFAGTDGQVPYASLIFDTAGNLYGTTYQGGEYGYGVVFKLAPDGKGGWAETVLHSFHDRPGANPWANLIFDSAGNLFGTTAGLGGRTAGDSPTHGCVFEITP